jgi:hypothetical protein
VLNLSAFDQPPAAVDSVGMFLLLDFLMGSSIVDLTRLHDLPAAEAEGLIRRTLLKSGYGARKNEAR